MCKHPEPMAQVKGKLRPCIFYPLSETWEAQRKLSLPITNSFSYAVLTGDEFSHKYASPRSLWLIGPTETGTKSIRLVSYSIWFELWSIGSQTARRGQLAILTPPFFVFTHTPGSLTQSKWINPRQRPVRLNEVFYLLCLIQGSLLWLDLWCHINNNRGQ